MKVIPAKYINDLLKLLESKDYVLFVIWRLKMSTILFWNVYFMMCIEILRVTVGIGQICISLYTDKGESMN